MRRLCLREPARLLDTVVPAFAACGRGEILHVFDGSPYDKFELVRDTPSADEAAHELFRVLHL